MTRGETIRLRERVTELTQARLGDRIVCACGATAATWGDLCQGNPGDRCPGVIEIEKTRKAVEIELGWK